MTLAEFQDTLTLHASCDLAFILPGGEAIPSHAHVTEVGRVEKVFLDCGGKLRRTAFCSLQIWVADDVDHRLPAGKLAAIIGQAEGFLGAGDLEMQVECQQDSIALFSVGAFTVRDGILAFALETKQTACLAMDICLPGQEECCGGSGCC